MSVAAKTLGIARSNLAERKKGTTKPRGRYLELRLAQRYQTQSQDANRAALRRSRRHVNLEL